MRQWWQRRSLRLRLTFWYAITSTVVLLVLGGLMFLAVRGRLLSQLDRQLRGDFEMIESRVVRDPTGNLRWLGYGHDKDEVEWEKEADPWFEILSSTGSILLREGLKFLSGFIASTRRDRVPAEELVSAWPSRAGRLNGKGGHIELESELARGSLFRIVMPILKNS
jgi:hypothetical protein